MLLSLALILETLTPGKPSESMGRAIHALFINWLSQADAALASNLHDSGQVKPFTVSDIQYSNLLRKPLESKYPRLAWLRITTFSKPLSNLVNEKILPDLQKQITDGPAELIQLGNFSYRPVLATIDPEVHHWAGQTTYESLIQENLLAVHAPPPYFDLEFSSPTTFHTKGKKHLPLPLPEMLLGSWLDRWNAFSTVGLPQEARPFAGESLAISRYRLETQPVHFGESTYIGFIGRCGIRLLERDPYWTRLTHTLARFAFYCGSGAKTTQGMGMTRMV